MQEHSMSHIVYLKHMASLGSKRVTTHDLRLKKKRQKKTRPVEFSAGVHHHHYHHHHQHQHQQQQHHHQQHHQQHHHHHHLHHQFTLPLHHTTTPQKSPGSDAHCQASPGTSAVADRSRRQWPHKGAPPARRVELARKRSRGASRPAVASSA